MAAFDISRIAVGSLVLLSACSGGGDPSPVPAEDRPVAQSDLEIAQLLYSDAKRTPDGFYQETAPSMPFVVTTAHLKNTDLGAAATQFELCTDDWNTALAWSDQVATGAQASSLMETNATEHYFEFGRLRPTSPQIYVRARVYRCAYLDRSNVDLRAATGNAGTLNQRPLSATELKSLAEYLWQFSTYNNYGNVVLKSSAYANTGSASQNLAHSIIIASLPATSSPTGCDQVSVIAWTYTADLQTGLLQQTKQILWRFGARNSSDGVEPCTAN